MSEAPPILIVDDQVKLVRLITELMNRLGFPEVEGVTDGRRRWSSCAASATAW